ncbi:MAG: TRAP-type transport system periplasmic protein [Azoarcus sp.]|uniref:Tripartite ATP-independent transporter solute receptor, DctP family n=1 Tax=Aromatoleum tolulyticum TaxID=34027 RepID=A0A1N7C0Q7_9RHOO|nr:TRAP transporter substrate-binding protein [Aromatoleum tolulyticum]MCK9986675.1 TRAP-type transport system periplasmic protein [Azoarcus sp.]SIR57221.1 tripartite ATP-independent transporter solute receptor, DctP family [Aromatoleum tolulyticum]
MNRRTFQIAALALSATLAFPAMAQTVKLTLGHGAAPSNPRNEAAVKFAETVKARTNGRYEIQVAHSAQLGDDAAMVTALRSGTLDMSANSQGAMSAVVPEYNALGLPFLFSDIQQAWQLLDGPVGEELAKRTAAKGMVVLGYWDNGIRHITNSKRPIKAPADLKGLKIRTPPDAMTVDIMQALGADAQQIKFSELYVALQQGVVDGQENPLANIAASKIYEVQKYLSLTGHKYESTPFLISKRTWDRLAAADQKVFMEAAAEATQMQRKLSKEADEKLAGELKAKGVQIDTVDRKAFVDATRTVYDKWSAGDTGDFVKRAVQQVR